MGTLLAKTSSSGSIRYPAFPFRGHGASPGTETSYPILTPLTWRCFGGNRLTADFRFPETHEGKHIFRHMSSLERAATGGRRRNN
uniref:Uncharacterized protein n=1 Tax=Steinernema glaseri TaxID=37863 RepID=A0A1I7YZQ8_9BILA